MSALNITTNNWYLKATMLKTYKEPTGQEYLYKKIELKLLNTAKTIMQPIAS